MIYASACDGIGAVHVAWKPLGWRCAWTAEVAAFPAAVIEHHFGHPNLGDITEIADDELNAYGPIDLLVGGTPCQSFSVAGLRKGMADPRGNVTLAFLSLVDRIRPQFVVWENVPGILSSSDGAFGNVLEAFNNMGYAIDCDILDAQYFGVPQRRRRVFLVCHNVEHGRKRKTPIFANTVGTFLTDALLSVLAVRCGASSIEGSVSAWPKKYSSDGLRKRMRLFGMRPKTQRGDPTSIESLRLLLNDWADAIARSPAGRDNSGFPFVPSSAAVSGTRDERSRGGRRAGAHQSTNTPRSWNELWAALCAVANASTTSTATRTITNRQTYTCAETALSIVEFIVNSTALPASCFDGDGFGLTALRAYTRYARQAANDLFAGLDSDCDWLDFARRADGIIGEAERYLGDRQHTGSLFPVPQSLSGDSPPGREAGERVAGTLSSRTSAGGGLGTDFEIGGGLTARTLMGKPNDSQDPTMQTYIAHTEGFDASEDGTGRGTPLVADKLREHPRLGSNSLGAVTVQGGSNQDQICGPNSVSPTLAVPSVRRLTPEECEKLQGFSPGHTAITYRNKPAADGPRYKALGNSMAVPVMRWIGERIAAVEEISA